MEMKKIDINMWFASVVLACMAPVSMTASSVSGGSTTVIGEEAAPYGYGQILHNLVRDASEIDRTEGLVADVAMTAHDRLAGKKKLRSIAKGRSAKAVFRDNTVYLEIPENAVYEITHDTLMAAGIDLRGIRARYIAVSYRGEGIARHIDGLDKADKWTQSSRIVFRGEAPNARDKLYLDANRYQLSLDRALAVDSEDIAPYYTKELLFEANNAYSLLIPSDDPFYDAMTYSSGIGTQRSLYRNLVMPPMQEGTSTLTVYLDAFNNGTHHVLLTLNGTQIADAYGYGYTAWPVTTEIDNSLFVEGNNQLQITVVGVVSVTDVIYYDKTVVGYEGNEPNSVETPAISPETKTDMSFDDQSNYLIIAHPLFINETLERYAQQRREEGWSVKIVNVEDIYAAYGYGMATPDAIKTYLDEAALHGVTHVQLVGAATYDPHNYLGYDAVNFIPSPYVKTDVYNHFTPSDTYYVNGGDDLPDMAIGRWPVRTSEQLEAVVNKTLAWEHSGQSAAHTALFIADKNEGSLDFGSKMDEMYDIFSQKGGWSDMAKVYLSDFIADYGGDESAAVAAARDAIKTRLEAGASVTMYNGHATESRWSYKGLLKQNDIPVIDNAGATTIALPIACYSAYADSPSTSTIAHQMMAAGENGAVAIFGAAALTRENDNKKLAEKVTENLLDGETLGDAVKDAKQTLGTSYRDVSLNNNLLGDVTLKFDMQE